MKKALLLIAVSLFTLQSMAQVLEPGKQVYKSPNLKDAIKTHAYVAILPLDGRITYRKQPKYLDTAAHASQEQELGYDAQMEIYSSLMREFYKFKVRFQNVAETNALLQKNGMANNLESFSKQEIAQALGVDAIIFGEFERKQNTPNVGTVTAAVFGYDKASEITITLKIANGANGEIIWRYAKQMNEMGNPEAKDAFDRQMEKLTRNLPYTRGVFTVF